MTHPSSPHDKAGSEESQDSRSLSPTSIPPTFTGRQSPLPSSQPPSHSQPPSFHAGTPGTAGTRHSRSTPWRTRPHRRRSIPAHVAQGTPTPFTPVNMSDSYNNHLQPPSTSPGATGRRVFFMNRNRSDTSIESSALLDHREQQSMRPRRASMLGGGASSFVSRAGHHRALSGNAPAMSPGIPSTSRNLRARDRSSRSGDSDSEEYLESAPLISGAAHERSSLLPGKGRASRPSTSDSGSLRRNQPQAPVARDYGSVNFPPSVPSSPRMDPRRPLLGLSHTSGGHYDGEDLDISGGGIRGVIPVEMVINIEDDLGASGYPDSSLTTPPEEFNRQNILRAEEDVCFPVDDGFPDEEVATLHGRKMRRRRRVRQWPDLSVLEEWSRDEKEERSEGIRTKKMSEPVYVGGRLRSGVRTAWHREEDEAPYRFTYFNDELPATIHSHTISELLQPGQTFKDLFKPEPRVQEDSSSEGSGSESEDLSMESEDDDRKMESSKNNLNGGGGINGPWAQSPIGRRPTFWLDVFSPTDAEMKVLSKAFGIHPLTTEDIMMQETREKVELFRSYYLVSYRTFEQDSNSENFLEPVNIYVIVFREGVISFHFAMTPHPANVRRRIRQLKDYITVSADWISYALIDDITDAFAPLIQDLEEVVDDIDDAILRMHVAADATPITEKNPGDGEEEQKSDGDMLKRVGDTRKKVMGLYRLLGNKADVIKGFAKRCNEQWEVAPRSEIGLYLGDIQDHIVTMVSNLNHMEKILSRSHSNYLAQINIKMNERQEQTADVLGRLTVLGTIVLPMNIITGLWGMNVVVPGQFVENLNWFYSITGGLLLFGFLCYFVAKRVYKIM